MTASSPPTRRAQQAQATREAIIAAARDLFTRQGYLATGTEQIVTAAGVGTRGALYHHFGDKEELFREAFQAQLGDSIRLVADRVGTDPATPMHHLRRTVDAFFHVVAEDPATRAMLIDGPQVLGWKAFRQAGVDAGLESFADVLERGVTAGEVRPDVATPTMALMLINVVAAGAVEIAEASKPTEIRSQVGDAIDRLIAGLMR